MARKKKHFRTEFRKNRSPRPRQNEWTRRVQTEGTDTHEEMAADERISGKGELTRKRTVTGQETSGDETGFGVLPDVDEASCRRGRVLGVFGLNSTVEAEDGTQFRCATRRLLKTLSTEQRHVVAAGDLVWFRPSGANEGIIERVEPRHGVLSRTSRGRQHLIVTNVDQLVIVASAAEPYLKPNLIDRFLVSAERNRIQPIICINKIDLIDAASLEPLVGVYSRMGYCVLLVSARTGLNVARLRQQLAGRQSVVTGQSGVGKSSLLNAVEPGFDLRVRTVSAESQKGRHTTTTARVLRLANGAYVVDTPGLRQFQLWDIVREEIGGFYRDLRPFVSRCRFPDCTHIHEEHCAVKDAVADGWLDTRRYESYCHLFTGEPE
ncbi:MAG TPA: ribosome small subunit-dependent GTPase A [Pirellulales bacterium]|jgi:ribosome biogenesis GTPase|nr:ribosome small subunit-dependent GTPase A [Pirellulales bacterium]